MILQTFYTYSVMTFEGDLLCPFSVNGDLKFNRYNNILTLKYDMPVLSLAPALPMQDREKFSKGEGGVPLDMV